MNEPSSLHLPIIVMGVSGCGKSSVAQLLAEALGRRFVEGDTLHPPGSIAKMSAGIPLDDADRVGWLGRVAAEIRSGEVPAPVVSCSALKRKYRQQLRDGAMRPVRFLYLQVPRDQVVARMSARTDHFMPPGLVDSQFSILEDPSLESDVISIAGPGTASQLASRFLFRFHTQTATRPRDLS
jgi:gluconokinase